MKRILALFLALAVSVFGQSFPVKVNSSGNVTEPSSWAGQNFSLTGFPQLGGLNISGSGTLLKINYINGSFTWDTGVNSGGGFQIEDQNTGRLPLQFATSTDMPQFGAITTAGVGVFDSTGHLTSVAKGANSTVFGVDGTGNYTFSTVSGTITGLTTNGFTYANSSSSIASTAAATNGQILIGKTGSAPVASTITQSSANQVIVTNGAGSITLSLPQDIATTSTPSFSRVISTVATGTAPFTVSSTTNVANLNASSLNGATFASPGAIGSSSPGTGVFTTLGAGVSPVATAAAQYQGSGAVSLPATSGTTQSSGHIARFSTSTNNAIMDVGQDGGAGYWVQVTDAGSLALQYALLLNPRGGFVGINQISPSAPLDVAGNILGSGSFLSSSPSGGIGYKSGAGGTVTQLTSRTTGVTLNTVSGAITLVSAAGSATYQTFTVTDSAVAATDTISINQKSGSDIYLLTIHAVGAGSFQVSYATTGGTTTEQPVFQFNVIKGSNN